MLAKVRENLSGSIGIPAEMRDLLGVRIGEMVEVDYTADYVVIRRPVSMSDRIKKAKEIVRHNTNHDESSWSDELLAQRRDENAGEGHR